MKKLLLGLALLSSSSVIASHCEQVSDSVTFCKYETSRILFKVGKCESTTKRPNHYSLEGVSYYSKGEIVLSKEWQEINGEIVGEVKDVVKKDFTTIKTAYMAKSGPECKLLRNADKLEISSTRNILFTIMSYLDIDLKEAKSLYKNI